MRIWLVPLLAGTLSAATVRGTVVENLTGHPLAHASVLLEPIPGSPGIRMTVHSNRYGLFEFDSTAPGTYLMQATRAPFLTAYYGQKRWNSAGMPFKVTDSETQFLTINMRRYAAISGTVVDDNDVGQPEFQVAAYRNTLPLQLAANGTGDERGVFRIYGLLPGSYVVRSVGKEIEGVGYKPTFAHESESVSDARTVDVEIEQEFHEVSLRALRGQLFTLNVGADPIDPEGKPVTLTLVSEMSRQVVQSGAYTFNGLPRGDYEVFAEAPTETAGVKQGAYQRISLNRDTSIGLTLRRIPAVRFEIEGLSLQAAEDGTVKVLGRRKDLAGSHDTQIVKLSNQRASLTVGPWEFALAPLEGYYVSGFSAPGPYRPNKRVEGWNEALITGGGGVRFTLSGNPGTVHGTVTDAGDPVAGAPVFLEPMDLDPGRRVTDTYVAITDIHGRYQFPGLAPGRYRVLSSFEYQMPDSKIMAEARARELQIDARTDQSQDLELFVIR